MRGIRVQKRSVCLLLLGGALGLLEACPSAAPDVDHPDGYDGGSGADACTPKSCAAQPGLCGQVPDGCGGWLNCEACPLDAGAASDGGRGADAGHAADGGGPDGGPGSDAGAGHCVAALEVCDGKDNDCDGQIDEGCTNPSPSAVRHYVDNAATGNNTGTSWPNAWRRFADIDWAQVGPGDVLFVSGGPATGSKTYRETMTISGSGQSGKPILVTRGRDPGHDGEVVIDGEDTRSSGIHIRGRSDLVVSGFSLHRHTAYDVYVSGNSSVTYDGSCTAVVVEGMTIETKGRGVFFQTTVDAVARKNHIETPTFVNAQTDGIYVQRSNRTVLEGNYIIVRNTETTGHDDCIQSFEDTDLTARGNFLKQDNSKTSNAQGIYATAGNGTFRFYSNTFHAGNTTGNGIAFRRLTGTGTVEMVGNTVYGVRTYACYNITETPDPVFKNNIAYSGISGSSFLKIAGWNGTPGNIDYNLYYGPHSSGVWAATAPSSNWSQVDQHSLHGDPKFVDLAAMDFHLQPPSPAVDRGTAMGVLYAVDQDGMARPQGAGWDIGAFER